MEDATPRTKGARRCTNPESDDENGPARDFREAWGLPQSEKVISSEACDLREAAALAGDLLVMSVYGHVDRMQKDASAALERVLGA